MEIAPSLRVLALGLRVVALTILVYYSYRTSTSPFIKSPNMII
jgi:hypothetical protein